MDGQSIITESGEKICIGDHAFDVGEAVWTDGRYAFGNDRRKPAPFIPGEGAGSKSKYVIVFLWNGASSGWATLPDGNQDRTFDGDLVCRIYDTKNYNYVDVQVGMSSTAAFCYNKSCTKFCWLTTDGTNVTIRTLANGTISTDTVAVGTGKLTRYHIYAYIGEDDELYWTVWTGANTATSKVSYELYSGYTGTDSVKDTLSGRFVRYKGTTQLDSVDYAPQVRTTANSIYAQIGSDIDGQTGQTLSKRDIYTPSLADVQALYPDGNIVSESTVWTEESFKWATDVVYNKLSDIGTFARRPNKPWVYVLFYAVDYKNQKCKYELQGDGAAYIKSISGYYTNSGANYSSNGGLLDNSHTKRRGYTYGERYTKFPAALDDVEYRKYAELGSDGETVYYSRSGHSDYSRRGSLIVKNRERTFYDASGNLIATVDDQYTLYPGTGMPDTTKTGNDYAKVNYVMAMDDGYLMSCVGTEYVGIKNVLSRDGWSMEISDPYKAQPVATDVDDNTVLVLQSGYSYSMIKINKSVTDDWTNIVEGNIVYNTSMPLITDKTLYELMEILQAANA